MTRRPKSLELIRRVDKLYRQTWSLGDDLSCHRAKNDLGVEYSDEERARIEEAFGLLDQARMKAMSVMQAKIGQLVMKEIQGGQWRPAKKKEKR